MNTLRISLLLSLIFPLMLSCDSNNPKPDIQGHRGARGLMPENTIPSFITALEYGVNTLELDVVINGDGNVLVSHEPFFSAHISTAPDGSEVSEELEASLNIFRMSQTEIKRFDVGMRKLSSFPRQEKMKVSKPLLSEVFEAVKEYQIKHPSRTVAYNIEIKSVEGQEGLTQPDVKVFSDAVVSVIRKHVQIKNVNLQSFDFRVLRYLHEKYPEIRLAALVENGKSIEENLTDLGFLPEIYSPEYILLDQDSVKMLHEKGLQVIPWTVNNVSDMKKLTSWGVDGIITDYPDSAKSL
ncbi:glycerophosphoryl diester phosphodiesterase [Fulvitalea axinellae]|uniref:Glycerophosphoryl diester phosphodiesterase n=1 Tax=Fulvitalea axinellae TaxID=1182444 RepID=A0AAU9CRM8_9BACT|nr:glycerophosphoryl diester phosphodiesterase [Fulvitalea axinellae]